MKKRKRFKSYTATDLLILGLHEAEKWMNLQLCPVYRRRFHHTPTRWLWLLHTLVTRNVWRFLATWWLCGEIVICIRGMSPANRNLPEQLSYVQCLKLSSFSRSFIHSFSHFSKWWQCIAIFCIYLHESVPNLSPFLLFSLMFSPSPLLSPINSVEISSFFDSGCSFSELNAHVRYMHIAYRSLS